MISLFLHNYVWEEVLYMNTLVKLRSIAKVLCLVGFSLIVFTGCQGNIRTGDVEILGIARFKMPALPKTGPHAVQLFTEMHYQPSYRSQEKPRLLPPSNSVPISGLGVALTSLEEYSKLEMPLTVRTRLQQGKYLYQINCMVCHGSDQKGIESNSDPAKILQFWPRNKTNNNFIGPAPANLKDQSTVASTDGEIFAFISYGGRQGFAAWERDRASASPMPAFQYLLTEEEKWALVNFIRTKQKE